VRRRAESFPSGRPGEHNDAMTHGQVGAVCPQCGSAATVHSVEELAAMARTKLGEYPPGYAPPPPPGYPAAPSGFPETPSGFPQAPSGFPQAPLGYPAGPPPESWQGPGPPPGYTGQRRPTSRPSGSWDGTGDDSSIEDDVASIVMGAATKFIGRAIGRRVKRAYEERVVPAMAAKQEAMLREQIAIAERHPDLRACMTDQVVFLAGGSRVLPIAGLIGRLTLEQSDALVAQLRDG
jgi:hypothetical protein